MKFNMYLMVLLCSFSLMQASDEPAVTTAEVELDFFVSSAIQKGLANLKIKTEEDYAKSKQDYLKYKQIREQRKQDLVNYSNQLCHPLESQGDVESRIASFLIILSGVQEQASRNNVCDEKGHKDFINFYEIKNIVKPVWVGDMTTVQLAYSTNRYFCWPSQSQEEDIQECVTKVKRTMEDHIEELEDLDTQRISDLVKLRITIDQQSSILKLYPPLPQENMER